MKKNYFFWSLLGLLSLQMGWAQQKTVTGNITDETGLPLPGATVIIENTNRGASTDFDGNYTIEAAENEVLVISYVGYSDQRITIGAADSYNASLQPGNELEEVVVTNKPSKFFSILICFEKSFSVPCCICQYIFFNISSQ